MRYTTLIDISEIPAIYDNPNVRSIYLHMALKCGYHDYDRDIIRLSIRDCGYQLGISFSAARHAFAVLQRFHLIKREGQYWRVRKFIETSSPITPRKTKKATQRELDAQAVEAENHARVQKMISDSLAEDARVAAGGKSSFEMYLDTLRKKAAAGDLDAAAALSRHEKAMAKHK